VTAYVQAVSEQLSEFSDRRYGNQRMLNTLTSLLSYSLQVVTSCDYSPNSPKRDDITQTPVSDLPTDESIKDFEEPHNRCLPDSSTGPHVRRGGSVSTKQVVQLVDDILQTAADLMLVRETTSFVACSQMSLHPLVLWYLLLVATEAHWHKGAKSRHRSHQLERCLSKRQLHSHRQWLSHFLHACFTDHDSVWSSWRGSAERRPTVCPQSADWARALPLHLGKTSYTGESSMTGGYSVI